MTSSPAPRRPATAALAAACIVTLALNLRPTAIAIGPLLGAIRADLRLDGATAGLLTTLPVLAFATVGAVTPSLAARWGAHRTVLAGLALLVLGGAARLVAPGAASFLGLTVLALAGMAIGNVLLPSLVRRHFPSRVGLMTASYSLAINLGVALASTLSAPLAAGFGGSWRAGLAVWVACAAATVPAWIVFVRRQPAAAPAATERRTVTLGAVARTPLGWAMAVFFGIQSIQAYSMFGWMPTIYTDAGMSPEGAGLMLGIATAGGIPFSFWIPAHIASARRPQILMTAIITSCAVAMTGLMVAPLTLPWLWPLCLTLGLGAFPAFLTMVSQRAHTPEGTAALSGFAQSVGYLLAATGPLAMGVVSDLTGGWFWPLAGLVALCPIMLALGLYCLRPLQVEDQLRRRDAPTG